MLFSNLMKTTYYKYQVNSKMKNSSILFLLFTLIVGSCTKQIEEIGWDIPKQNSMLVVDGMVTNEHKKHEVNLSLSSNYFSKKAPFAVQNASVSINDGTNDYLFSESTEAPGKYISDEAFAGMPGNTYSLNILLSEEINGKKTYTSSAKMKQGLDIDSIYCEVFDLPEGLLDDDTERRDTNIIVIYYYGYEPETKGDHYFAKVYKNEEPLLDNAKEYPFSSDIDRNGEYTNMIVMLKNVSDNDVINFNLYSATEKYYDYINSISKIDETGSIYSPQGPPANALGNVEGALGYFVASYHSSGEARAIKFD